MKIKSITLACFLLLLFCTTCKSKKSVGPESGDALLAIDVESDFRDDLITVELDDNILHEGKVTTNYSIVIAWSERNRYSLGVHVIKLTLPEKGIQRSHFFNLKDSLTILVRYDRKENKISFDEYNGFFMRE